MKKRLSKKLAKVDRDYCVACGACKDECKFGAITIKQGVFALINGEKCVGCGKCSKICPASVIKMISREVS
ncbi:MAG: 4Fe-4S binding protein [Epulopiscium sp.]|nr:4Fe-4S binding protein [Candidatus Epulonipiscium sp.]